MKPITPYSTIVSDVVRFNEAHYAEGKNFIIVPAASGADMAHYVISDKTVGGCLDAELDLAQERDLRDLIVEAIRNQHEDVDYYALCVKVGAIVCAAVQCQADNAVRREVTNHRKMVKP